MSGDSAQRPPEFEGRLSPGKNWMEIVAWVGDLPPLPQIAARAITLVEDPDTNVGQVTALLSKDTALAARVLKIANSAMFSRQREVTTLNQAIMMIGFKALKGIIVAATLRQINRQHGSLERVFWQNSLATGMAAMSIAEKLKKPYIDEVFLLGLLHDLGKLVLLKQVPTQYKAVVKLVKEGHTFFEAEQEVLGYAHPLIGALVAKKWNFSAASCQVILHHHDPVSGTFNDEVEEKTAVIKLANIAAHASGNGNLEGYPDLSPEAPRICALLNLEDGYFETLLDITKKKFSETGSAFE